MEKRKDCSPFDAEFFLYFYLESLTKFPFKVHAVALSNRLPHLFKWTNPFARNVNQTLERILLNDKVNLVQALVLLHRKGHS